jgi:hypothetical protein
VYEFTPPFSRGKRHPIHGRTRTAVSVKQARTIPASVTVPPMATTWSDSVASSRYMLQNGIRSARMAREKL